MECLRAEGACAGALGSISERQKKMNRAHLQLKRANPRLKRSRTTSKAAENEIALQFFEIARVLVRFSHVASFIVDQNHSVVTAAARFSPPGKNSLY